MADGKVLVCENEDFKRVISRNRAKGHKNFIVEDDVKVFDSIEFKTDGDNLVMKKSDVEAGDDPMYTILCQEFGLVCNGTKMFDNEISVIFLDEGWMLVTLIKGAIVIKIDGKLMMPSRGVDKIPSVIEENICWEDETHLLSFSRHWKGARSSFPYDYELNFVIGGNVTGGCSNMHIKPLGDRDIDISLGYIAQWEKEQALKEEARSTKKLAKLFTPTPAVSSQMEFDDDDDDYEDEEELDEDDDWDEDDDF